jgi:small nuclear ribonucleoprotein (snRNP)-like protein
MVLEMAENQADLSNVQVEAQSESEENAAQAESVVKKETQVEELVVPEEMIGRDFLRSILNRNLKVELTDGRVLIGIFLCTDRDANMVLGSCKEYSSPIGEDPG